MKVVLLEGLGVSEQVIEQHARKLESMGHTFVAYPKNTDPLVQAERSRDADVIMLAYNRSTVSDPAIDEQVSLEELLKRSDIVSLHCPLTADTKGMIGKDQLALMKKSALLINTARGGVLDSAALADALEKGEIAGAACDVFETEPPLPTDHPLLHCPNTIVTPHIAFASVESMEQRADIVFNNLYSWLDGKQVNAV